MIAPALLEAALRLAGVSLLGLTALRLVFPRRFRWREELARISLLNRQIFHVHTFFVCLTIRLMGALCLFAPGALLEPARLGRLVNAGFALFWAARLYVQGFVYSAELWRGRRLETVVHVLFTGLWTGYTVLFGLCFLLQCRTIGAGETLLAAGILSGLLPRLVAGAQIGLLLAMNAVGILRGGNTIHDPVGLLIGNGPLVFCALLTFVYGPGPWTLRRLFTRTHR